ncbi:MAG: hypothetical protein B6D61_08110 [Bacteroidetes bacterium 4484_249]|nr:MAG: hypothetical protein B6D61_08110 [Bacteroidetes bacterium 4484_249]
MKTHIRIITTIVFAITLFTLNAQDCVDCSGGNASGNTASIIGIDNTASETASFAGGTDSEALGKYSFAFGDLAKAWSRNGIALGKRVSIFGPYSFGVGENLQTTITSSMIIGCGFDDNNPLVNGISRSLMIGFNSDKPTLFVGMSDGVGYTGKVAIGDVTDPQAKLHIKADDNEQAVLFIEPHTFSAANNAYLWMGTSEYGLRAGYHKLYFNTGGHYIFNSADANVGIGVLNPTEKLEIDGNIKQSAGYFVSTDKVQATGTDGLRLYNQTGSGLYINTDGNVGVGINSAQYKLTVYGKIFTNSDAYIAGNLGVGTDTPQEKLHVVGNGLLTGNLDVSGDVTAATFTGDGSALTNVDDNDWTVSGNDVYRLSGNVGIGTTAPQQKLDIAGSLRVHDYIYGNSSGGSSKLTIYGSSNSNSGKIEIWKGTAGSSIKLVAGTNGNVQFFTNSQWRMSINDDFVELGNPNTSVGLKVHGKIEAEEIEVKLLGWSDFVFDKNYKLKTLTELEDFIYQNGHLPNIPSGAEVLENGINVGEMNALLLQKIEELTLYVIELEKEINKIGDESN